MITGCLGLPTVMLTQWDRMPWNRGSPPPAAATVPAQASIPPAPTTGSTSGTAEAAASLKAAEARTLRAQAAKLDEIAKLIAGTPITGRVGTPEPDATPPPATAARADPFCGRWASADDDYVRIAILGAPDAGGVRYGRLTDGDGNSITVSVDGREMRLTTNRLGVAVPCHGEVSAAGTSIFLPCTALGEEDGFRLRRAG